MEYFFATAYRYLPPVEDPFRRLSFVLFSHHVTIPLLFQPRCSLTHPQIFTPATCHFSLFSTAPSTDLIYTSAPSPLFGTASSSQPSILYCSNHPIVPKLLHFLFSLHITNILPSFETHNPHSHHRCSSINICFQLLLIRNADFLHFAILPTFLRSVSLYSHAHPSPAATMAPMVVPVTATAQTSTSLVAASTRGTTSNVSTTLFTTPKLPSETNAYSVGSSLCSYFHADGLVNTVLVNHVAPSHMKGYFQTCNDSRVLPPLGTPNDAMEKLPPKVDVLQIAHPIHPPKEPDKGRRCQVPILYSPLRKARLHLEFIPHYMTFAMIVFNSYGSRRNILAHDVFDKRQKREIAQNYVPHRLFLIRNVACAIEPILVFQTTFLTRTFGWVSLCIVDSFDLHELYNQYINSKFGEPNEYFAYLDTFSQPQKIPRKLKSSRQYRIFLKVETEFEE
ncbi:uncharacterized protein LOC126600222 isoform X2 [Malus sylvestris]|uniref:uncharacterized protein LOC126600222 isoform X2 n=1 Tax=Malus sylvestris TaxID=3752 RepID=UPI0021ABEFD1|nr:uncharacterized protein LOC126600222 isoform X2 [Malus sylvestris]